MKKIVYLLIVSFLFSILNVTNEVELQAKAASSNSYKGNIKITAAVLNVRQEKSVKSQIISTVTSDEIYKVLEVGFDLKGNIWYKVNPSLVYLVG